MAESGGLTIDRATLAALKRASEAIGHDSFYHLLLDIVRCCLPSDLSSIVRYSPFSPPDLLLGSDYETNFCFLYAQDLYRYDPFCRYWKEVGLPGVVSLNEVVTTDADHRHYVSMILSDIRITDEIAIFMPPVGRSSLALFLDRCGGSYSPGEIERTDRVYDLIVGLHTSHVNAVFGSANLDGGGAGAILAGPRPTRILDRGSHEVVRNAAWEAFEAQHQGLLVDALEELGLVQQARIAPDLILHRTMLPTTFHLAPRGFVETIEPLGLSPATPNQLAIPDTISRLLSQREVGIVDLMLQGYPTKKIAERLGLTQGTVKNYRRRIYDKLDVTTEREVFLSCVAELGAAAVAF